MAIVITQHWPEELNLTPAVHVTEAQPELNYDVHEKKLIVDLPTYWIYIPRNGRIEIEATNGDK